MLKAGQRKVNLKVSWWPSFFTAIQELSPKLQFGQKEVGHFWDSATSRQEWNLHSQTKKRRTKTGWREESSSAPLFLEMKLWLWKVSLVLFILKITAWSCSFIPPWRRFCLTQNQVWQKWFSVAYSTFCSQWDCGQICDALGTVQYYVVCLCWSQGRQPAPPATGKQPQYHHLWLKQVILLTGGV